MAKSKAPAKPPRNIAAEVKSATHSKATPEEGRAVATARAKRQGAQAARDAAQQSAAIEKQAKRTQKPGGDSEKVGKALGRITGAMDKLAKGEHHVPEAARRAAKKGVLSPAPAAEPKSGRGRKADPNSARQKALAERQKKVEAGEPIRRGRPKSPETIAREQRLAEKRERRAQEGKDVRGRESRPDSKRSTRKARADERTKELAKPIEARTPSVKAKKGSLPTRPSEAIKSYREMKVVPQPVGSDEERGLHKRGSTTVTYMRGGHHKIQRRTLTVKGKRGQSTMVSVMRNLRAEEGSDRYKPFHSYRQAEGKDAKTEESIRHASDPRKTQRIKFTRTRSAAGVESERMEVSAGRRSMTKATRGARGAIKSPAKRIGMSPATSQPARAETARRVGVAAMRGTFAARGEGTMPRSFDQTAHPSPMPKEPPRSERARLPKATAKKTTRRKS
jgi:hypothetical protein